MFTGLIEEIGKIIKLEQTNEGALVEISATKIIDNMKQGDSIAVNGCCLTVTNFTAHSFQADISLESLKRTQLGKLTPQDRVHLERAMAADGRFGGHFLSGHIDCTGQIHRKTPEGNALLLEVEFPKEFLSNVIPKGSIGVQGASLTIADLQDNYLTIALIPHTLKETIFMDLAIGDAVNLEFDLIGKYVQRFLTTSSATPSSESELTMDFLIESGFLQ